MFAGGIEEDFDVVVGLAAEEWVVFNVGGGTDMSMLVGTGGPVDTAGGSIENEPDKSDGIFVIFERNSFCC